MAEPTIAELVKQFATTYGLETLTVFVKARLREHDKEERKAYLRTLTVEQHDSYNQMRQDWLDQRVQENYEGVQKQLALIDAILDHLIGIAAASIV